MRGGLGDWDGGDWFLVALGGGAGLLWALVSIVVALEWWSGANLPWWETVLRAVLLWPIFAAFYAPFTGADVFIVALAVGAVTGSIGGLLLALRLRRT